MSQKEKDYSLFKKYCEGDDSALTTLFEENRRPLFAYIYNMCGNYATAEEVFQETWLKVVKKREYYFNKKGSFKGWVSRIARNTFIDMSRKKKALLTLDDDSNDKYVFEPEAHEQKPDEVAVTNETIAIIQVALNQLTEKQKEVFVLRMEKGLTFKEIAAIQDTSVNTVLARMNYATNKMKEKLEKENLR
jgi:RNA polymerase sigma-70 factor (ECF subfamily)